jgi:hypothetical protein
VGGLFGFAITSALFSVVGTVLRGVLRPISWLSLATSLGLLAANQLQQGNRPEIARQDTTSAVDVAQSPAVSPTSSPTISSPTASPPEPTTSSENPQARGGWESVAEEVEPILSDAIAESEQPTPPSPDDILADSEPTQASSPAPSPIIRVPASPSAAAPQPQTDSEPIQGFW